VNELLVDLAGCRASRVLVFVEQSYSSVLSKRLRSSSKHLNVVPIISPAQQYPDPGEGSWKHLTPRTCLIDHLGKVGQTERKTDGQTDKYRQIARKTDIYNYN
jgi:hypothetical protein